MSWRRKPNASCGSCRSSGATCAVERERKPGHALGVRGRLAELAAAVVVQLERSRKRLDGRRTFGAASAWRVTDVVSVSATESGPRARRGHPGEHRRATGRSHSPIRGYASDGAPSVTNPIFRARAPTPFGGAGVKFGHRSCGHAAECDFGAGVCGATTTDQPGRRVRDRSRDGARDHAGPGDRAHDGDHLHGLGARDSKRVNAGQKATALAEAGLSNALAVLNQNYPCVRLLPGDRDAAAVADDDLPERHGDLVGDSEPRRPSAPVGATSGG